jgi:hypothetical protein
MALSKEEIAIRVGVDSRAVRSGMAQVGDVVDANVRGLEKKFKKFSGDVLSGAVMGFVGSLTTQVTGLIEMAVDKLSNAIGKTTFNWMYGVNDYLSGMIDRIRSESNKLGRRHESARARIDSLNKEESERKERESFESRTPEERRKISFQRVNDAKNEIASLEKQIAAMQKLNKEEREANPDKYDDAAGIQRIVELEEKLAEATERRVEAQKLYDRAWKDSAAENSRETTKKTTAEWMDAPESKPETVIDAWKAKIGAQQARWKQMTDFSDFGKKKKEIEQRTKAEEVVKVRVVSVDD